jgi:hypothetical protein
MQIQRYQNQKRQRLQSQNAKAKLEIKSHSIRKRANIRRTQKERKK